MEIKNKQKRVISLIFSEIGLIFIGECIALININGVSWSLLMGLSLSIILSVTSLFFLLDYSEKIGFNNARQSN